ncbi:hypothetical protein D1007_38489 [Hordeum vulgare]|nr:hypothetical protein D1007_38489 [Hordeum vulgare]
MKESLKFGSDKTEMLKKEYQDHLGPMEEPEEQEGGLFDHESSGHSTSANSNSVKNDAEEVCEQPIVPDGTNVERRRWLSGISLLIVGSQDVRVQSTDDITGDAAAPRNGTEAQRGAARATRNSARIAQMGVGHET